MNRLYYGDCLTVMRDHMKLASVDLIYLDPPFSSQREYNAIYKDETGRPLPDQIEAFRDLWELDEERERALRMMPVLMREAGIVDEVAEFWRLWMNALRGTQPRLLAYLSYMVERLLLMKGLLRPTGSVYLHCDPTASHYIKVMMDAIFGHENFRNEVVWKRTHSHGGARRWGPIHDTLLFYSKGDRYTWNRTYQPYTAGYLEAYFSLEDERGRYAADSLTGSGVRTGDSGLPWRDIDPTKVGRHWAVPRTALRIAFPDRDDIDGLSSQEKLDLLDSVGMIHWPERGKMPRQKRYAADTCGIPVQDIVTDINPAGGGERMGYATQKPIALLERIIQASTNPGDVVFDPFCGCATTMEAAHSLGRRWIGIDIAIHAVKRVATVRLRDRLKLKVGEDFTIQGVPRNLEGARDLWERDKYHFQKWAVESVDGFVTSKRTADGGVDGRLYFDMPGERELQSMAIEVKGGRNVTIADVRALLGVLENETAQLAGLIIMEPLSPAKTRSWKSFMAQAGDLEIEQHMNPYPRMQLLTVADILEGKRFRTPGAVGRGSPQMDWLTA